MTFQVINGGGGRGDGAPRRKHWLAEHLWRAVVNGKRATSVAILAERMSKTAKVTVSIAQANHVLTVVRSNSDFYGWSVFDVAKGPYDTNRRYIPVLVDWETGDVEFDETEMPYIGYGIVSNAKTIASMTGNAAVQLDLWIAVAPKELRRAIRAMQGSLAATSEMADKVAVQGLRLVN
jgi:hypothetical protein